MLLTENCQPKVNSMDDQRATREIRKLLYALKRRWGFPATFYQIVGNSIDLETGRQSPEKRILVIQRVILLPADMLRKFSYDLSFIASNKAFTYGGFYDQSKRMIIVDRQDIPSDFEIKIGNYFIFRDQHWEISELQEFEFQTGYIVGGTLIDGNPLEQTFEQTTSNQLSLSQVKSHV
jgi:hypothetical protein